MRHSKSRTAIPDSDATTGNHQRGPGGWYTGPMIGLVSLALSTSATGSVPSSAAKSAPVPVNQPLDDLTPAKSSGVLIEDELVDVRINPYSTQHDGSSATKSGFSYYRNIMLAQGGDCSRGGGGYSPPSSSPIPRTPPPAPVQRAPAPSSSRSSGTAAGIMGIFGTILSQPPAQEPSSGPSSSNPMGVNPETENAIRRMQEDANRRAEESRRAKEEDDARRQGINDPFASTTSGAGQNPFESGGGGNPFYGEGGHGGLGASAAQDQMCMDVNSRFEVDLQAATNRSTNQCVMMRAQRAAWEKWRNQFAQACNPSPQFAQETRRRDQSFIVEYGRYIKQSCGG